MHSREFLSLDEDDATDISRQSRPGRLSCALLDISEMDSVENEWVDLLGACDYPNPFWTPAFLKPALAQMKPEQPAKLLCVWEDHLLIAFLPVTYTRGRAKMPFPSLTSLQHHYCYLGDALIRPGREIEFVKTVHEALSSLPGSPKLLRLNRVPAAVGLIQQVQSKQIIQDIYCSGKILRPAVIGKLDYAEHIKNGMTSKKRGEVARQARRLNEIGPVEFQLMTEEDDPDSWSEAFMTLEDKGWKGKAGTSFASKTDDAEFFMQMVRNMAAEKLLVFQRMMVGSQVAAMSVNFLFDGQGYGFKSCFDEELSRFSPGVLATLNLLEYLGEHNDLQFFDTCSTPGQSMLERYWPHHRKLTDVIIGSKSLDGRLALGFSRSVDKASALKKKYIDTNKNK